MASKPVGDYVIEYSAIPLYGGGWGAAVAIYGPAFTPLHRNCLLPLRRVSLQTVFPTRQAAEEHAEKMALSFVT